MKQFLYLLIAIGITFCISFMDYGHAIIGLKGIAGMFLFPISIILIIIHVVEILSKKKTPNWAILLLPIALFLGFFIGDSAIANQDIKNKKKLSDLTKESQTFKNVKGRRPYNLYELKEQSITKQSAGFDTKQFDYYSIDSINFGLQYVDNYGAKIIYYSKIGLIETIPFSL